MREVEHLSRLYIAHQFVMAEVKLTNMLCNFKELKLSFDTIFSSFSLAKSLPCDLNCLQIMVCSCPLLSDTDFAADDNIMLNAYNAFTCSCVCL